MAGYSQQVLIATGQPDWRSRIEEDGVDEEWGMLGRGLKGLIGRGGKYSDVGISFLLSGGRLYPVLHRALGVGFTS